MKYLRRGNWFFAGRLLVICLILGLMITAFYYSMNLSNIQIVLKDGMVYDSVDSDHIVARVEGEPKHLAGAAFLLLREKLMNPNPLPF